MKTLIALLCLLAPTLAHAAPETATAQIFHSDPLDPKTGHAMFATYALRDSGARVLIHAGTTPYRTDIRHGDRVLLSQVKTPISQIIPRGAGRVSQAPATKSAPSQSSGPQFIPRNIPRSTRWTMTPLMQRDGATVASVVGVHKTAVILATFADVPTPSWLTPAQMRLSVFDHPTGSIAAFFRDNSYGLVSLVGDVYGPFVLPLAAAQCPYGAVASLGTQAAIAQVGAAKMAEYQHRLFIAPFRDCAWSGLSTVGGSPSQSWVGGSMGTGTGQHEMGHAFGNWHSHGFICPLQSICPAAAGILNEYGDTMDTMGSGGIMPFNAAVKRNLGWLGIGNAPPLTTVTANGTYPLDAYEPAGTAPKALRIASGSDSYFVEARRAPGLDPTVSAGVLVHIQRGSDPNGISLLDMTPLLPDWGRPALPVGATFTDPVSKVSITLAAASSTGATVTVAGLAGGITPPPTCPPTCDPPPVGGDVTTPFTYVNNGKSQTFAVSVPPATCDRITGGTRQLRIWVAGKVVRWVTVDNPNAKGEAFAIRCFVNGASTTAQLRVGGVLKASVTK